MRAVTPVSTANGKSSALTGDLPANLRAAWAGRMQTTEQELAAYQRQMSILTYLEPGEYSETHIPYNFDQVKIGLILRGNYYLLPVYTPGTAQPLDAEIVRAQMAALLASPGALPASLALLAQVKRAILPSLRHKFNPALVQGLESLRYAPILLTCRSPNCARPSAASETTP
jgi:hypothetical protein